MAARNRTQQKHGPDGGPALFTQEVDSGGPAPEPETRELDTADILATFQRLEELERLEEEAEQAGGGAREDQQRNRSRSSSARLGRALVRSQSVFGCFR